MLNQEGIRQLKFDLRSNAEQYDQEQFGTVEYILQQDNSTECSTVCCMAGWCLRRRMGSVMFTQWALDARRTYAQYAFGQECMRAAAEQLGLSLLTEEEYYRRMWPQFTSALPPIFGPLNCWPPDLRKRYQAASAKGDRQAVAEVACDALDRMDEHGFIGPAVEPVLPTVEVLEGAAVGA
jgi:hypothetical protein